jgi:hypothetical protein
MKLNPKIFHFHPYTYSVMVVIGIVMTGLWISSLNSGHILCLADCGEVFDALQYVSNYKLYGFKYLLIQDMATSPNLAAHPYFYTHNVNIGGYFFTILEAVGAKSLVVKQFFILIVFALGLLYFYWTISSYTSSRLAGFIALLFFCSDYEHVLVFGLNSLRAWHWLALFGLMFHLKKVLLSREKKPEKFIFDYILFVIFAFISFGLGYDFWVICIFVVFFILFFFVKRPLFSKQNFSTAFLIGCTLLSPFLLRQLQIIAGLGFYFWAKDLYYSAAIKVSFLNNIFPVASMEQVDNFYELYNVQRPPAFQSPSFSQNMTTLKDMLINIVVPTYGTIPSVLGFFIILCSIIVAMVFILNVEKYYDAGKYRYQFFPNNFNSLTSAKFLASVSLGIFSGLGFFAPLSFHIYLKHQFPLVAVLFILPKAFLTAISLQFLFTGFRTLGQKPLKFIAVAMIVFCLIGDHFVVQHDNYKVQKAIDVSWIETVENMPGETFAVSWIPSSVSVFTDNWAVGIKRESEFKAFHRISDGSEPFRIKDFFLFGERDAEMHPKKYQYPSFWLYFPTEQSSFFDSPIPTCRQDYVVNFFRQIFPLSDPQLTPLIAIYPGFVQPGADVLIVGSIKGRYKDIEHVYVLNNDTIIGQLLYNCIYNQYTGIVQIPRNSDEGKYNIVVRADYANGEQYIVSSTTIDISKTAPSGHKLPNLNTPQMSIEEIVSRFPEMKIYKRSPGFIIFDLRK